MKDIIFDDFQNSVNNSLLRHRSILDILSKYQESQARASRAICKSVTNCGCIEICTKKQNILEDVDLSLEEFNPHLSSHTKGDLCENCREVVESEIGNNIFYLTSLCNALDLNLFDILLKEYNKIDTLGRFTFR